MTKNAAPQRDAVTLIGLILSGLAFFGWLSIIVFFLAFPYSEERDIDDFFRFLRNVIVLAGGGTLCGVFSITGLIMSCIGVARQRQPTMAYIGLGLSLGGITVSVPVVFWRLTVLFG